MVKLCTHRCTVDALLSQPVELALFVKKNIGLGDFFKKCILWLVVRLWCTLPAEGLCFVRGNFLCQCACASVWLFLEYACNGANFLNLETLLEQNA